MWKRSGLCAGVSAALRDQGLDSVWFLFLDFPETGFLCLVLEFSLMTRLALNSLRLACLCLLAATEGMWSDPVLDQVLEGIEFVLLSVPGTFSREDVVGRHQVFAVLSLYSRAREGVAQ